ncbi:hypothetical protein C5167_003537 [Papaver somniferum]|uniref:Uncharacterized protein n=1 Tax=Papaver somniferum TaxID=3469 RepID=A0A4Y7KRX3_PAPSO|nr:hypothetical protein C5167_003537 [Papaver somniferum]
MMGFLQDINTVFANIMRNSMSGFEMEVRVLNLLYVEKVQRNNGSGGMIAVTEVGGFLRRLWEFRRIVLVVKKKLLLQWMCAVLDGSIVAV